MKDLIEALQIMMRYMVDADNQWPTQCEHDVLYVWGFDMKRIPFEDVMRLMDLSFLPGFEDYSVFEEVMGDDYNCDKMTEEQWNQIRGNIHGCFYSFRFGSC